MSQSTNDVYPTALKLAAYAGISAGRRDGGLRHSFEAKAEEFKDVIKMGRTQLQDAVPMTLGQEFSTYAVMLGEDESGSRRRRPDLRDQHGRDRDRHRHQRASGLCGTRLPALSGDHRHSGRDRVNLVEATQDCGAFVQLSGVLKRVAVKLSKTCNDLRLLSSGPRAGLGEINLPPMQAGSSIMPGKVNPGDPRGRQPDRLRGDRQRRDGELAAEAGQLQLNAFEPIIAHSLFKSVNHLRNGCLTLAERCVNGITANREHLRASVERLDRHRHRAQPLIGYANATDGRATSAPPAIASTIWCWQRAADEGAARPDPAPEVLTQPRSFTVTIVGGEPQVETVAPKGIG